MNKIESFAITNLFGYANYTIRFTKNSSTTIISGPNGCGKTHVLRLIRAVTSLDFKTLSTIPFEGITIRLRSRKIINIALDSHTEDGTIFRISGNDGRGTEYKDLHYTYSIDLPEEREVPPYISQLPDGTWVDLRDGRVIPPSILRRRYGIKSEDTPKFSQEYSWLNNFFSGASAIFIDTQRLDREPIVRSHDADPYRRREAVVTRISRYIEQVRAQITDARRASLSASQIADQSFASRVLESARTTVKESDIRSRYQKISKQHAELHSNGLSEQSFGVQIPTRSFNPTERRILNVFLDDLEKKLKPLLPMNEKIKALRRIIDDKFIGKRLVVDQKGFVRFRSTTTREPIKVSLLSSGEQHLLAMFTMLLFSAEKGSLVLIDEPEISMHAAWKHAYLDDIGQVAEINDLQIVLATHSTAIINGQWDLVQEIGVND
ncbi:AAA family ATPase [Streptosporangium sp. NPDC002544]|uniref:AAA family ATPase n=1 Tax=Streptosporangium sp. NPDC002544 TaxID=3154538 RepID=UPI00331BE936